MNMDIVGHLWYNIIMHILRLYCQDMLGIGLDVIGPSQDKTSMSENYSRINLISHISASIHIEIMRHPWIICKDVEA